MSSCWFPHNLNFCFQLDPALRASGIANFLNQLKNVGRSRVTFAEWMRMDVNYIRGRSLWRDVTILAETIPAVLMRRGAK